MTTVSFSGADLLDRVEAQQPRLLGRHRPRNGEEAVRASGAADPSGAFARALSGQGVAWNREALPAADEPDGVGNGSGVAGATNPDGIETVDLEERSRNMRVAAEEFSGFFLGFMFKEMRKTVEQNPFAHGDSAERTFQELADEAYADEAALSRSNAITDLVYQSLMRGAPIPKMG